MAWRTEFQAASALQKRQEGYHESLTRGLLSKLVRDIPAGISGPTDAAAHKAEPCSLTPTTWVTGPTEVHNCGLLTAYQGLPGLVLLA